MEHARRLATENLRARDGRGRMLYEQEGEDSGGRVDGEHFGEQPMGNKGMTPEACRRRGFETVENMATRLISKQKDWQTDRDEEKSYTDGGQ